MYSLSLLTVIACVLSLLLTPLTRDWSIRLGLVDRPDQHRKKHSGAIARTGGVAILLSYTGAYALILLLPLNGSGVIGGHLSAIWRLMPPVAIILATGLLDDWLTLRPWQKLAGETVAAMWAYTAGVRICAVGGHETAPWCGFLLTIAWLILCSNAFNLVDGMDGLAAGVGLTATMTTCVAGLLHHDMALGLATAPLAGCLLGFLRYNFNPASIFLGDSGSLLIGFLLGSYAVIWSQKSATMLGVAAPAMALALPLLEVGLSVLRRFLRNEPIFTGDRGHIHHRLLDRGFTPRKAALVLYGVCGLGAMLSLLQYVIRNRFAGLGLVFFAVATSAGIHYLEYVEFEVTRYFLWAGLRPTLSAHVKLKLLERSLATAADVGQCWSAIEHAARLLGYSHMNACIAGRQFATAPDRPRTSAFWQMRLNLPGEDYVNITQAGECEHRPVVLIPFVELISRILPRTLAELEQISACPALPVQSGLRNSSTRTVISSDCAAPSVNAATAS
jgi:UDP-GlcNAc:undecaprenyl-phosphate/decaprenyl-phosphate GlcNAc-1-phosphate transferase